ncbi:transporter substrate-binding domain-containing protein [Roseomonas elaeocarpi]|uniref:Transporter substrate-binding domain-containing protein n=1 Tax=Roseomonas elaeocarpi TaxID=907779 RepID=A0ABV6JUR1_9PROT
MTALVTRRTLLGGLTVSAGLVGLGISSPARADQLDDITKSGRIRISTDVAIPPAGLLDAQMRPSGSDVETGQLLAKDWGLQYELIPTIGATRIPNILTGKADIIISTLSVTPERARTIDFSRAYTILQSVVAGPGSTTVNSLEALKGMTVAVTRGTTQDTKLSGLASANGFTVSRYDDDATLVTAAASGQALLMASSVALVNTVAQKNPALNFAPKFVLDNFDIAIGVRKGEARLVAKLNEWILANLQNGKLNEIYKKYYNVDLPASLRPPEVR